MAVLLGDDHIPRSLLAETKDGFTIAVHVHSFSPQQSVLALHPPEPLALGEESPESRVEHIYFN